MRICFVGLDGDLALPGWEAEGVGGEAIQHALLAQSFHRHGHHVSMIARKRGQQDASVHGGVHLIRSYRQGDGIPGLRFIHPRVTSMWRAMETANADVYYQSPAGMLTGLTAMFCRVHRRLFLFRVASDVNCVPGRQLIRLWRDRRLYEWGLRRADIIAAQTREQMRLLKEHYGLEARLVSMATEAFSSVDDGRFRDVDVLWVGNLRPAKRPELLLTVAESLPDARFVMIGGACPGSEGLYREIERRAALLDNVRFLGFRPNTDVNAYLLRSRVFANTSSIEGFPNTFLQAWLRQVPIVSFFDPDGVVASQRLGLVVKSVDEMRESLQHLLADEALRSRLGSCAKKYVDENHHQDRVVDRYLELIEEALGAQQKTAGIRF